TALSLGVHEFENDEDLNFEAYLYEIELWVFNVYAAKEREQHLADGAAVYQALRATEKYPLLLVDDLQVKLAEYSPLTAPAVEPI
ncbi:MAG TPA: hypothetical protein PKE45_15340, partial [Caldilineaceae bacterium]|nr:hypothetical protein [Caldilineaceae bacterium]